MRLFGEIGAMAWILSAINCQCRVLPSSSAAASKPPIYTKREHLHPAYVLDWMNMACSSAGAIATRQTGKPRGLIEVARCAPRSTKYQNIWLDDQAASPLLPVEHFHDGDRYSKAAAQQAYDGDILLRRFSSLSRGRRGATEPRSKRARARRTPAKAPRQVTDGWDRIRDGPRVSVAGRAEGPRRLHVVRLRAFGWRLRARGLQNGHDGGLAAVRSRRVGWLRLPR